MYHFKRSDMGLFSCVPIRNILMTFGILCLVATLPNPQTATSDCRTPSSMRRSDEAWVVFPLLFLLYNLYYHYR